MDLDLRREILQVAVRTFADLHSKHKHSTNASNRKLCEEDIGVLRESIFRSPGHESIARCLSSFTELRQKHCPQPKNLRIIEWDEVAYIADYLCLLRSHAVEFSSTNYDSIPWKCAVVIIRRHYPLHEEEHPAHLARAKLLLNGTECRSKFDKAIEELGDFCNGKNEIVTCRTLIQSARQSLEDAAEDLLVQQQLHEEAEAAYRLSLAADGNRDAVTEDEDEFVPERLEQGTKAGLEISEAEQIVLRAKDVWKLAQLSRHSITQQTVEAQASSAGPRGNNPDARKPKTDPRKHGPAALGATAGNGKRARDDGGLREECKVRIVSTSPGKEAHQIHVRKSRPLHGTGGGQTSQSVGAYIKTAVQIPGDPKELAAVDEKTAVPAANLCTSPETYENTATFALEDSPDLEAPVQSHREDAQVPTKGGHKGDPDGHSVALGSKRASPVLRNAMVDTRTQSEIVQHNLNGVYIDGLPQEKMQPDIPTASDSFVSGSARHGDSEVDTTTAATTVPLPTPLEEDPGKGRCQATGNNSKLSAHYSEGKESVTNQAFVTDPSDTDQATRLDGAGTPPLEKPIEEANVEMLSSPEQLDTAYHQAAALLEEATGGINLSDVRASLCSNDLADDRMAIPPDPNDDFTAQHKGRIGAKPEKRLKHDISGYGPAHELRKPGLGRIRKDGKDRCPPKWQQRNGAADAVQKVIAEKNHDQASLQAGHFVMTNEQDCLQQAMLQSGVAVTQTDVTTIRHDTDPRSNAQAEENTMTTNKKLSNSGKICGSKLPQRDKSVIPLGEVEEVEEVMDTPEMEDTKAVPSPKQTTDKSGNTPNKVIEGARRHPQNLPLSRARVVLGRVKKNQRTGSRQDLWKQGTDKRGAIVEHIAKKLGQHLISESPIKFLPDDVVGHRRFDRTKTLPIDFGKVVKFNLLGLCDVNETIAHMNMPAILLEFLDDSKRSQEVMDILLATLRNSDFLRYHIELYKTLQPLDDNTLASLPQSAKVIFTYFKSHPNPVDQTQIQTVICSHLGIQDFNTEVHDRIGQLFKAEVQSLQNWRMYMTNFNQQIDDLRAEAETKITAKFDEAVALRGQLNDLQTACLNIAVLWGIESAGPVDKAFITQLEFNAREVTDLAAAALAMAQDMAAFCDRVRLLPIYQYWESKGKPLAHFMSRDLVQNASNIRGQITDWLTGLVDECENLQQSLAEANRNTCSALETTKNVTSSNSIMKELVQHAYPELDLAAINDVGHFSQTSKNQIESFRISKIARDELVRDLLCVCNAARDLITGRTGQGLPQPITEKQLMDHGDLAIICNGLHTLLQDYGSMKSELDCLEKFCRETEEKAHVQILQQPPPNKHTSLVLWANLSGLVGQYVTLRDGERVRQKKMEDTERQIQEMEGTIQTLDDKLSKMDQGRKTQPVHIPGKLLPVNPYATLSLSLAPSASSKDKVLQTHRNFAKELLCLKKRDESEHRIDLIKKHLSSAEAEEEEYYLVILSLILDKKIEQRILPPSTRQVLAPLLRPDFDPRSNEHQSRLYKMCAPWYMTKGPLPETWEAFQKRARLEEAGGGNDIALAFVIRNFRTIVRDEIGSFLCHELCVLLMDQTELTKLQSKLTQSDKELRSLSAESNALHVVRRAVLESYPRLKDAYNSAVKSADQLSILEKGCKTAIQASQDTREIFFQFYNDVYCIIAATKFLQAASKDVHEQYFFENMKTLSSLLLSSLNDLKNDYTTSQTTLEEVNSKLLRAVSSCEELETNFHVKREEENRIWQNRVTALEAEVSQLNNKIQERIDKEGIDRVTIETAIAEKRRLTEEIRGLQDIVGCLTKTKKEQETVYKEQLSQLDEVETLKQTADDRGEHLAAELEVVKTAHKGAELELVDLRNKNEAAVKRTKTLEDELDALKSQNEQLLESQRVDALQKEQMEQTLRAELIEGQKRCNLLDDELQRFRNEATSLRGKHPLRDEIRSGSLGGGISLQTLAKEQQRAMLAKGKMRKRSHTIPRSGREGHSRYTETAQACPSAQRSAASDANSAKLAITEEKLEAHIKLLRETNEKKSLLEGDLEQLTLMIRELDSSINGENSQALPADKCMTKLLQKAQRIRQVVKLSNEPNCDIGQGIENLGMQLRDYKYGVDNFEQVLRTIRGITTSETPLPTGEVGEIGKRCLFSVAVYVDGLFGTASAIDPEKTFSHADLRSTLTSFAQSGNDPSIPKLHNELRSLQAAELRTMEDKAKTEEDNRELRDRLKRKLVIAKRRAKRRKTMIQQFEDCLSKIKSTFSETLAPPNEKKSKVFALCDHCTPIHETLHPDEKRHRSNCPVCEPVMAVLKFTRSKEELRVNLLWELIAYMQIDDRLKERSNMVEKLRNAHLDSALALRLCDTHIGEETPAKPPRAYELLFRTLQEFQKPRAPRGVTRKPTQCSVTQFASIKEEKIAPARPSGVKTALQVNEAELGNFVVSFAGDDWCICAVMTKNQSQPSCDVVLVKTEKIGKGILESTYCIADAMVILESASTAAKAWPVANTIYDFCAKHGPDLCKLPPGIRFKKLEHGKPMYRNDVVTQRLAPCKIRAMGPHVRAACIGGTGEIDKWEATFEKKRKRKTEQAQEPRVAPQLRKHSVVVHVIADEQ